MNPPKIANSSQVVHPGVGGAATLHGAKVAGAGPLADLVAPSPIGLPHSSGFDGSVAGAPLPIAGADVIAIAARQVENNPLGVVDRQLINLTSYANAAAAARGVDLHFTVAPEVHTFFAELGDGSAAAGNVKTGTQLKAMVSALVDLKFMETLDDPKTKPGQVFLLAINPELTAQDRAAMKSSIDLGSTLLAADARWNPLMLIAAPK